jgi:hypothetical protein
MSDNTQINPGTGGDIVRDIDRGDSVKRQVVALDLGGPATINGWYQPEVLIDISTSATAIPVAPAFDWSDPSNRILVNLQTLSLQVQINGPLGFTPVEIPTIGA